MHPNAWEIGEKPISKRSCRALIDRLILIKYRLAIFKFQAKIVAPK
jgi:hypothetical protein